MSFVAKARLAVLVPNNQYQNSVIRITVNDGVREDL